jgi:hypothetical protein
MNEPNIQPSNLPDGVREALQEITKLRKEAYDAGCRVGFQRGFEAGVAAGLGQAPKYPNGPHVQ